MAQQTFSGVPGAFTAGEVLSSSDMELIRDYLIAQIKEGMTGDTGEILPMIMDLTNNRIVLDTGGLEFSDGTTMTTSPGAGDITAVNTAANTGLAGGSTSGAVSLSADVDNATVAVGTTADYVLIQDVDDSDALKKSLVSSFLTGYAALAGANFTGASQFDLTLDVLGQLSVGDYVYFGGTNQGVVFEGTADSHETFLIATNPTTTDRTITLPDCTGTVLTSGNPNDNILTINSQSGTTYTLVLTDGGKMITSSNGSAQTITVPPNSSVAFPIGTQIIVQNLGSANATLAQGSGVTIQSKDSNKEIDGQYASAALIKTATDTWSLIGALT